MFNNNDDVPVDLGGAQQRRQTAALSCHLIPNKLETTRLPFARSASTFGHHSTFAQVVRFLPFSHLPADFFPGRLAGSPPFKIQTLRYSQAIPSACAMRAVRQIKHYSMTPPLLRLPRVAFSTWWASVIPRLRFAGIL